MASYIARHWLLIVLLACGNELPVQASRIRRPPPDRQRRTTAQARIVGGRESSPSRYPYMASLSRMFEHNCGATLIAPDIVLTAAHCVGWFNEIEIGRHDLTSDEPYESFVIQHVVTHPRNFVSFPDDVDPYDFCIVKLYGTSQHTPIRINRDHNIPNNRGDPIRVIGWGVTAQGNLQGSNVLRETDLEYIPNDECIQIQGEFNGTAVDYQSQVFDVVLCAMDTNNFSDACQADSGGPALLVGNDATEDLHLGIISAGFGCGHPVLPGLYARTSTASDWIDDMVCQLSANPPPDFHCPDVPRQPVFSGVEMEPVTIEIEFDDFPEEWGWILQSTNEYGVELVYAERPIFSFQGQDPGFVAKETIFIPGDREYRFTLLENRGDGFCCVPNRGSVTLYRDFGFGGDDREDVVPRFSGRFSFSKTFSFVLGNPTRSPVESTAPSPSPVRPLLTVWIQLDQRPTDTGFLLEALPSSPDQDLDLIAAVYPGTYANRNGQIVTEQIFLRPQGAEDQEYRFTMTDNEGDGSNFPLSYQVWLGDIEVGDLLFSGGGSFFFENVHTFTIDAATPAPSTVQPSDSPSLSPTIYPTADAMGEVPSYQPSSPPSNMSSNTEPVLVPTSAGNGRMYSYGWPLATLTALVVLIQM